MAQKQKFPLHSIGKRRNPFWTSFLLFLFLELNLLLDCSFAAKNDPVPAFPIRLFAVSDVLEIGDGSFRIREFLDVKNDSYSVTIEVKSVTAEIWKGHRLETIDENWLDRDRSFFIGPGEHVRVAERTRVINGVARSHWRIRWARFRINTNYGDFFSNYIDSPFWEPGEIEKVITQPKIDSLSQP